MHPCRHVGPAFALPGQPDPLDPHPTAEQVPLPVIPRFSVAVSTNGLVGDPQASLRLARAMPNCEPIWKDPGSHAYGNSRLILGVLVSLPCLQHEPIHSVVGGQDHRQRHQRLLPCPFLAAPIGQRSHCDDKVPAGMLANEPTYSLLVSGQAVSPMQLPSIPESARCSHQGVTALDWLDVSAKKIYRISHITAPNICCQPHRARVNVYRRWVGAVTGRSIFAPCSASLSVPWLTTLIEICGQPPPKHPTPSAGLRGAAAGPPSETEALDRSS